MSYSNLSTDNKKVFRLIFASISILFVFHILNDLDLDLNTVNFVNVTALENIDNGKERIESSYIFDSSEYFEEDNMSSQNNTFNNKNKNNQIQQQQSESGISQLQNKVQPISKDFITIKNKINLSNIDDVNKYEQIKIVGYLNGEGQVSYVDLKETDKGTTTKTKINEME